MIENRLNKLREFLQKDKIEAVLISKEENVRYFSDFTGDSTVLLVDQRSAYLITDGRYTEQAQQEIDGELYEIILHKKGLMQAAATLISEGKYSSLLVEGEAMALNDYLGLKANLQELEVTAELVNGSLDELRIIKDEKELEYLKTAVEIADEGFKYLLEIIKPGISEKEVARELEYYMAKLGSEKPAFTTIVASGKRGALPHGVASNKLINSGEFVTIDFGAVYKGYHSDITRTVAVGKIDTKLEIVYNTVLEAQLIGLQHIAPKVLGKDVDQVVRQHIIKAGYGEYFNHGLGHGVGLEIHELPRLSSQYAQELLPNMVVTNEPGIYIPDLGGVRIEDTVLVTEDGCQPLTQSEKKLIIL